jgi:hypothetical protein
MAWPHSYQCGAIFAEDGMSNWISFQDLLNRWGIENFEALEYLKKGLQPYKNDSGRPLNCPSYCHLGHIKQFVAALATPVGQEILKDTMMTIEDKIALIFAEKDTPSDRAELRVYNAILAEWQSRVAKVGMELNEFRELSGASKESAEKELEAIKKDDPDFVSWKWLTDIAGLAEYTEDDFEKLFSCLDEAIFKADDVRKFEKKYKLKPKDVETEVFPCSPGTKWEEVKVTLIENEAVRIETPLGISRFSYHELGMSDKRSANRPTMLWGLFKIFAKNQGYFSPTNDRYVPKLPDTAKRLNKHLQDLFEINESIFTDHYKAEKGYRTKIFFSDQTTTV